MAQSSGEFIARFYQFVKENEVKLKEGSMVLPLNPASLERLNDALHEFRQIGKRITTLSPTSKGTSYRDTMTRLSILLEEIPCVRLESRRPGQLECKTMINLARFKALQYLEIDEVFPPLIQNLRDRLGPRLLQLICLNSGLSTMRDLLANKASDEEEGPSTAWSELDVLDCGHNQIVMMDESLHMLTNVKRVTLSHNLIRTVENLDHCIKLSLLDLGFNKITSVQDIHFVLGGVKVLVLADNQIKSTASLEKLYSLEKLDLSNNLIEDGEEVKRLIELPLLVYLNTLGNPVCVRHRGGKAASRDDNYRAYRRDILSYFLFERSDVNEQLTMFDDQPVSETQLLQQNKRRESTTASDRYTTLSPTRRPTADSQGEVPAMLRLKPTNAGGMAIAALAGGATSEQELAAEVNDHAPALPADLVRPKKKKKKRVAVIEAVGASPASPQRPPKSEPKEVSAHRRGSAESKRAALDEHHQPMAQEEEEDEEQPSQEIPIDSEFVAKIEELHKQGGTMWLLALNEMQRKEYEEEQRVKEREQRELQQKAPPVRKSSVPAPVHKNEASLKILEEIKSGKILQLATSPEISASPKLVSSSPDDVADRVEARVVTQPELNKETDTTAKPKSKDRNSGPINSRINLDENEDTTTEEFTVEVGGQLRILLISKRYIVEADVTTGRDVVSHEAKYITAIKSLTEGGRPAIHVEYSPPRAGAETRAEITDTATYILDEAGEHEQLLGLLQGFLNKNSQARVQCMRCLKIYDRLAGMQACKSCGSTYVVHYEEEKKPNKSSPTTASSPSSPPALSSGPSYSALRLAPTGGVDLSAEITRARADSVVTKTYTSEDFSSETMDVNLQLYLRLTFFRGGAAEQLVYFFTSVFLPYGAKTAEEAIGHIVLTTQNLYILQRKRRPTEADPGFTLIAEYKLSQIRRVVIGLFYQYFRLEVDEKTAFVFLPKEHGRTHAFIDLLLQTILGSEGGVEPTEAVHYNSETLGNMQTQLLYRFPSKALQVYVLLYQKLQTRPKSILLTSALAAGRDMSGLVTRAMIITSTHIILATEDYSRWPALHYPSVKPPTSPQFEITSAHEISELVTMELDAQEATDFKLTFEKEGSSATTLLHLKTEHEEERLKLTNALAKLWESMFKLPLTLKYYNIPG